MFKKEMNIEMRSLIPPESVATMPYSVPPKMANEEMKNNKKQTNKQTNKQIKVNIKRFKESIYPYILKCGN